MGDPLHTILTERLGCRWPIIQTAMGWIATPGLVIASSEAGAFGFALDPGVGRRGLALAGLGLLARGGSTQAIGPLGAALAGGVA